VEPKRYTKGTSDYPQALYQLPSPPPQLTTSGPLDSSARAVAVVGSRDAWVGSLELAYRLGYQLARAGVVVVSGGAVGVDGAAHRGAIDGGGATWVVCPTGKNRIYPAAHADLFAEIERSTQSRMIWPFPDHQEAASRTWLSRNGVLAAFSEVLVVVQAHFKSGSRNAASWARSLGRQVWAVPAMPFVGAFSGNVCELRRRDRPALPFDDAHAFFAALGLAKPVEVPPVDVTKLASDPVEVDPTCVRVPRPRGSKVTALRGPLGPPDMASWSSDEIEVFSRISTKPMHVDQITDLTGLSVPLVVTALLTLSLKDVVVEGPDGFFRRRNAA
jgi:DNA processing protein